MLLPRIERWQLPLPRGSTPEKIPTQLIGSLTQLGTIYFGKHTGKLHPQVKLQEPDDLTQVLPQNDFITRLSLDYYK